MNDYWPDEEKAKAHLPFGIDFEDPGGVIRDCFELVAYGLPDGTTMLAHNPWLPEYQMRALDVLRQRAPDEAARVERLAARRARETGCPWLIVDLDP